MSNYLEFFKKIKYDEFVESPKINYRNYLNVDLNQKNISNINSKFSIDIFNFIKNFINNRFTNKIINVKIKENNIKQFIIFLDVNNLEDNDKIIQLINIYSKNKRYTMINCIINDKLVYQSNKILSLTDRFINKSYTYKFDVFSRVNYFIAEKIYENINNLLIPSKYYICMGRDITIPSTLKNEVFENIIVACHNKNILKNIDIDNKILIEKKDYYQIISKYTDNLNIFISAGRKGLGNNLINELIKLKNCNLIVIWCNNDIMLNDFSLLNKKYNINKVVVFNEHPNTENLTTLINFKN